VEIFLVVCVGLIGGIAVGVQAPVAGAMSLRIGATASSVVVHAGGLLASVSLLVTRGGEQLGQWRSVPWYMLGSGALGLVLYLSVGQTIPKLGATTAITLIIVGQLLAGMVIDHFGAFGLAPRSIDLSRAAAAALLLAAAYLMVR
jgi:transporter family-2 protein